MSAHKDYVLDFKGDNSDIDYLEFSLQLNGLKVAAIDEVGRGCLAGEVVAACVVLPEFHGIEGISDSKKISEKKREKIYEQLIEKAVYGIGRSSAEEIDDVNIHVATHRAALRAFKSCVEQCEVDFLLCDGGLDIRGHIDTPSKSIIKGDLWDERIGAASILAKVTRDREMLDLDEKFPGYGFKDHKGYGTRFHREAIEKLGITPIHRKTFGICRTVLSRDFKNGN